jgi:hypothetical protein
MLEFVSRIVIDLYLMPQVLVAEKIVGTVVKVVQMLLQICRLKKQFGPQIQE